MDFTKTIQATFALPLGLFSLHCILTNAQIVLPSYSLQPADPILLKLRSSYYPSTDTQRNPSPVAGTKEYGRFSTLWGSYSQYPERAVFPGYPVVPYVPYGYEPSDNQQPPYIRQAHSPAGEQANTMASSTPLAIPLQARPYPVLDGLKPMRQSNWFYGLHFPTAAQLVVEPIAELVNGSLFVPLPPSQPPVPGSANNANTISLGSEKVTDVEQALSASWSSQPSSEPSAASPSTSQRPLNQRVNEFLNSAVTNIFGIPVTRTSAQQPEPAVADELPDQHVAAFHSAGPRQARATLRGVVDGGAGPANAGGVGQAYFYQSSPSDDVLAELVFATANGVSTGWNAFVTSTAPDAATCFPPYAVPQNITTLTFNPKGVPNGGSLFKAYAASSTQPTTVAFLDKEISKSRLSLYDPEGIIGRHLVITTAPNNIPQLCGEIILIP